MKNCGDSAYSNFELFGDSPLGFGSIATNLAMDVVYILGTGSRWNDNELRYSLRALARYARNLGKVYLVGERPVWVRGVVHIPCGDRFDANREGNMAWKIKRAAEDPRISDTFVLMNDDFILQREVDLLTLPLYQCGELLRWVQPLMMTTYMTSLFRTHVALSQKNRPTLNYEIHGPSPFNKKKWLEVLAMYPDFFDNKTGYVNTSMYANSLALPNEYLPDCKLKNSYNLEQIKERIAGRPFWSFGDEALNDSLKFYLDMQLPAASKFEF